MLRPASLLVAVVACASPEDARAVEPWQAVALPDGARRLEASAAALGTRLAIAGGFVTGDHEVPPLEITREVLVLDTLRLAELDALDDPAVAWSKLPDAPVAWTHAGLAGIGGALYLLGGLEGSTFVARGEAFVLDNGGIAWRELPPLPAGGERGAAAIVTSPGHVFLLGGATTAGVTASCLDFNTTTETWTVLPDLPLARSHAAAMRMQDGTLIVAGGIGDAGPLGDVWALPPAIGTAERRWELRSPMPTARGGCAAGAIYGQLVCAGGEARAGVLDVVESYDPTLDAWTTTYPAMPAPRAGAPGAVVGQRLFVVGGSGSFAFAPESTVYVFSLLDALER